MKFFFVSRTGEPEYINEYESASKFPSTGQGSQVRVNYQQLQHIKVSEYGSKFLSMGQDSRVRVEVPKYGSKFQSTGQGSWVRIFEKIVENHQTFEFL